MTRYIVRDSAGAYRGTIEYAGPHGWRAQLFTDHCGETIIWERKVHRLIAYAVEYGLSI